MSYVYDHQQGNHDRHQRAKGILWTILWTLILVLWSATLTNPQIQQTIVGGMKK